MLEWRFKLIQHFKGRSKNDLTTGNLIQQSQRRKERNILKIGVQLKTEKSRNRTKPSRFNGLVWFSFFALDWTHLGLSFEKTNHFRFGSNFY